MHETCLDSSRKAIYHGLECIQVSVSFWADFQNLLVRPIGFSIGFLWWPMTAMLLHIFFQNIFSEIVFGFDSFCIASVDKIPIAGNTPEFIGTMPSYLKKSFCKHKPDF